MTRQPFLTTCQITTKAGVMDLSDSRPMTTTPINGPTWVYNAYCEHNGLLYVGIAGDVHRRIAQHRSSKSWWRPDVDLVVAELFPTRRQALEVEAQAIFTMRPLHNIAGAAPMDPHDHEVRPHRSVGLQFYDQRGAVV